MNESKSERANTNTISALRSAVPLAIASLACATGVACSPGTSGESATSPVDASTPVDAPTAADAEPTADVRSTDTGVRADASAQDLAGPPARPSGAPSDSRSWFAVRRIYLGDTDRFVEGSGFPKTATSWQRFGYDLDGRNTVSPSTGTCAPRSGSGVLDGPNGIDNAFGARLLPEIQRYVVTFASPTEGISAALGRGTDGYLFDVRGLTNDAAQNATGLTVDLLSSDGVQVEAGSAPAWDGRDEWRVLDGSLVDGTLAGGSKVRFTDAYVGNGTLVSGTRRDFRFSVRFRSAGPSSPVLDVSLLLHDAFITAKHVPPQGTSPRRLDDGLIVGRLRRSEVFETLNAVLASQNSCSFVSLVPGRIDPLFDLVAPGQPASLACDEMSIAIGFDAIEVVSPTRVVPSTPFVPATCPASN
jgi:hypothetical protein